MSVDGAVAAPARISGRRQDKARQARRHGDPDTKRHWTCTGEMGDAEGQSVKWSCRNHHEPAAGGDSLRFK
jgi:hypothetical protein